MSELLLPLPMLIARRSSYRKRVVTLPAAGTATQLCTTDRSRVAIGFACGSGFAVWPGSDVVHTNAGSLATARGFSITSGTSAGHTYFWFSCLELWPVQTEWFGGSIGGCVDEQCAVLEVMVDKGFWDAFCEAQTKDFLVSGLR